jgi:hypothetical protein
MLAVLVAAGTLGTVVRAEKPTGSHASGRPAFGGVQNAPRSRVDVVARERATTSPSARSTVVRGMESLGVSNAYARYVTNQLENLHGGSGEALLKFNDSVGKLAGRWVSQGYQLADVVQAFTHAARETRAGPGEAQQVRTLIDSVVRHMGPGASTTVPGTGAALASPSLR